MRVPNAYCGRGCAAGAERLTGEPQVLSCTTLLGTPVEPALLRSLLTGDAALGAPWLLPVPGLDSTGRTVLPTLLTLAAAASGLAGIMLAPWELSRMEARTDRRREGVVFELLLKLVVGPFGLAEVRKGGAAGASGAVKGAKALGTCCLLPGEAAAAGEAACGRCTPVAAAAGLFGFEPACGYAVLSRLMYLDCLSAPEPPGMASPW